MPWCRGAKRDFYFLRFTNQRASNSNNYTNTNNNNINLQAGNALKENLKLMTKTERNDAIA